MNNILFLAFLISIFSCANDKPKEKDTENKLSNCELNLDLILEEYTNENLDLKLLSTREPLLRLIPTYDRKFKDGADKEVRFSIYTYDKRFDEDHWDLTFDETTYYNQKKVIPDSKHIYKDSGGRIIKKSIHSNITLKRLYQDISDSVVIKYDYPTKYYKIIRKYDQSGRRTHESTIGFNSKLNSLVVTNNNGKSNFEKLGGKSLIFFNKSKIRFYFDNYCKISKITSVDLHGYCLKIEFNVYSDIIKKVSYKLPSDSDNLKNLTYNEKYEKLFSNDYKSRNLSEYSSTIYNNYIYDSIGNWVERTGKIRSKYLTIQKQKRKIKYY